RDVQRHVHRTQRTQMFYQMGVLMTQPAYEDVVRLAEQLPPQQQEALIQHLQIYKETTKPNQDE
ncbi:MAG: hypothetical protein KC496_14980, partial [Anaerolineae bacterium]|nr:hypothetical protein [Anaerolineae bacterium]